MAGDISLFRELNKTLTASNSSIAVAESCTGGLIAHRITDIPGATQFFRLGVGAYSNESKVKVLKVKQDSITRFGAVSEEVAREMAEGIARVSRSRFGIGVTGIAGPGGGSAEKPVGTVYIGLYSADSRSWRVDHFRFDGERVEIKTKTASAAIQSFLSFLASLE
jgi:nicotinamide-nucleotide amidase